MSAQRRTVAEMERCAAVAVVLAGAALAGFLAGCLCFFFVLN